MEKRDREIIDSITMARMHNNMLWMQIVQIALEHAPAETKTVLAHINGYDRTISDLLKDLTK